MWREQTHLPSINLCQLPLLSCISSPFVALSPEGSCPAISFISAAWLKLGGWKQRESTSLCDCHILIAQTEIYIFFKTILILIDVHLKHPHFCSLPSRRAKITSQFNFIVNILEFKKLWRKKNREKLKEKKIILKMNMIFFGWII